MGEATAKLQLQGRETEEFRVKLDAAEVASKELERRLEETARTLSDFRRASQDAATVEEQKQAGLEAQLTEVKEQLAKMSSEGSKAIADLRRQLGDAKS